MEEYGAESMVADPAGMDFDENGEAIAAEGETT